jgi:hypothetical protein
MSNNLPNPNADQAPETDELTEDEREFFELARKHRVERWEDSKTYFDKDRMEARAAFNDSLKPRERKAMSGAETFWGWVLMLGFFLVVAWVLTVVFGSF